MRILQWPRDQALLRRIARPVRAEEFGTAPLRAFAEALGTAMVHAGGAGLAATQVAEAPGGEPWRIVTIRTGDATAIGVFNPVITYSGGAALGQEGCLSFASVREPLYAPTLLTLDFMSVSGEPRQMGFQDELARAVWHEVGHLDGTLIIDRMKPLARKLFLKAVAKRTHVPGCERAYGPN
jgi:peptide deformylase